MLVFFGKILHLKEILIKSVLLKKRVFQKRIFSRFLTMARHKNNYTIAYFVWILTCCIVFQFETSFSVIEIRMEMNEEVQILHRLERSSANSQ